MNRHHSFLFGLLLAGAAYLSGIAQSHGAPAATNAPAAGTNATAVASNGIPASVFEDTAAAGKDPFFPKSRRRSLEANPAPGGVVADISNLTLQGISSSGKKPLATINNTSFCAGEEGEVVTPAGRVRIKVAQIHAESVVVYLGAQQLELRLPQR
jgi:hypothetical protein